MKKCKYIKIIEYLVNNYIYVVFTLLCLGFISIVKAGNKYINFISIVGTYIFTAFLQYFIHILSHKYNYQKIYDSLSDIIGLKNIQNVYKIFNRTFIYLFEFHRKIHHNSKINKKMLNVLTEFYINFFSSGGSLLLINLFMNLKVIVFNIIFHLDNTALLLFALCYSTSHLINYHVLESIEHIQHHINTKFNYGPEIFDIIFDSKFDDNVVNENHLTINLLFFTLMIYFFKLY